MIPFTQFLRPDGRQTEVTIDRPKEIETIAHELIEKGCRFECEVLMNDMCSFTVEHPDWKKDELGPIVILVCANGPKVLETIDELVLTAKQKFDLGPTPIGI